MWEGKADEEKRGRYEADWCGRIREGRRHRNTLQHVTQSTRHTEQNTRWWERHGFGDGSVSSWRRVCWRIMRQTCHVMRQVHGLSIWWRKHDWRGSPLVGWFGFCFSDDRAGKGVFASLVGVKREKVAAVRRELQPEEVRIRTTDADRSGSTLWEIFLFCFSFFSFFPFFSSLTESRMRRVISRSATASSLLA